MGACVTIFPFFTHLVASTNKTPKMFMITTYVKRNSAQLTVVFQESKSEYSPVAELEVSSSAHKLEYIIITHRDSL